MLAGLMPGERLLRRHATRRRRLCCC